MSFMLSVTIKTIMLSVVMLNVIMLNVMAPLKDPAIISVTEISSVCVFVRQNGKIFENAGRTSFGNFFFVQNHFSVISRNFEKKVSK
jgi:hypothetical protein